MVVSEEQRVGRDADPDKIDCPPESRRSSTKRMDDLRRFRLIAAKCRSPEARKSVNIVKLSDQAAPSTGNSPLWLRNKQDLHRQYPA